jgi:hypothetical protein
MYRHLAALRREQCRQVEPEHEIAILRASGPALGKISPLKRRCRVVANRAESIANQSVPRELRCNAAWV